MRGRVSLVSWGASLLLGGTADQVFYVALSWRLSQTAGAATLGVTMTLNAVCRIALLPLGGVAADKVGHRRMSMLAEGARLASFILGMLYLLLGFGAPDAWFLTLLAVAIGSADAFYLPATSALIGDVRDYISLSSAVSARSLLQRGGVVIGPALGGVLVAGPGLAVTIGAAGLCCALSLFALAAIRSGPSGTGEGGKAPLVADFMRGLRHIVSQRDVFAAFLLIVVTEFVFEGLFDVGVPLLVSLRGWDPGTLGSLLSLFSVGAAISAVAAGRVFRGHLSMPFSFGATGLFAVFILAMGLSDDRLAVMACCVIAGLLCGISSIATNYVILDNTDKRELGRVSGMVALASNGTAPISYMVVGFAAGRVGAGMTFAAGGVLLLMSVATLWSVLRHHSGQADSI